MKKLAIITLLLVSTTGNAACLQSKGTGFITGTRSGAYWDVQYPGHSYRISYANMNYISVREGSTWKQAPIASVLRYKWNAYNVTTCEISRLLNSFHNNAALWK